MRAVHAGIASFVIAALAVACNSTGSKTEAAAPSIIPSASASASVPASLGTRSIDPISSMGPSASRDDRVAVAIEGTDLTLRLPTGWAAVPVSTLRTVAEAYAKASSVPEQGRRAYTEVIDRIDAGQVRLYAIGPSGFGPWQSTMIGEVIDGASLESQIEVVRVRQASVASPTSTERSEVDLPIGHAVRVMKTADPPVGVGPGAVPARSIDYFVALDDGRILWLNSTGPVASTTFEAMIDEAIATLRRR